MDDEYLRRAVDRNQEAINRKMIENDDQYWMDIANGFIKPEIERAPKAVLHTHRKTSALKIFNFTIAEWTHDESIVWPLDDYSGE